MDIAGRRIAMFRCVKDPMLGPKPRQAHMPQDYGWEAYMTTGEGIYIKTEKGIEHFIGAGNIESVRFVKEEPKPVSEFGEARRSPGKRQKEISGAV